MRIARRRSFPSGERGGVREHGRVHAGGGSRAATLRGDGGGGRLDRRRDQRRVSGRAAPAAGAGGGAAAGARRTAGSSTRSPTRCPRRSADPADGTRLKATYRLGADGFKEYVTGVWFDSQRSETCTFTPAGDGQQRCLPAGAGAAILLRRRVHAADRRRAERLHGAHVCASIARRVHVRAGAGADARLRRRRGGEPVALYVQSGTQCYSGGPASTGYSYFSVGAEVPATTFVAASTGPRLRPTSASPAVAASALPAM